MVMRLLDQPIEAKVKPVQELTCCDVARLWAVGREFCGGKPKHSFRVSGLPERGI